MPLQIRGGGCVALAVEPPGNIAREIALYRRALFVGFGAERGDASAFAFPEIVALCFARKKTQNEQRKPDRGARLRRGLAGCWDGIDGSFASAGLSLAEGFIFLEIEGPWSALRSSALTALETLGLEEDAAAGLFEARPGFLVCRDLGLEPEALPPPPAIAFRDASIVSIALRYAEGLEAARWREIGRTKRRTGLLPGDRKAPIPRA